MSSFISSYAISTALRQSILSEQTNLAQAQQEVSTGDYADVGLALGGDAGQDIDLRDQESLLKTFTTTNNLAATNLSSIQNVLTNLQTSAQSMLTNLTGATGENGAGASLQTQAQSALQGLIAGLNTNSGGDYLFAGANSSVAPITDYYASGSKNQAAVNSAFSSAFGFSQSDTSDVANITASQMQSFLGSQLPSLFQGTSWTSDWSSASNTPTTSEISPSQSVDTSVSANNPAFQDIAQAYTMLASVGTQNLSTSALQTVMTNAENLLNTGLTALTNMQADVGTAESNITSANNQMTVEMNVLSTQIGNLEGVNPLDATTAVTNLQTQIETSYELTSQLSQLSLVKYL
jgi:flagellar hook-associated protein 3 FlgL